MMTITTQEVIRLLGFNKKITQMVSDKSRIIQCNVV